jgi:CHAT domain-containing protein/tetratricopeptide (TPR) repeat protein
LDEEIFKPPILKRLQTLASRLREAGQICDALSISLFLSDEAESNQEKEGILRQYLDDPSLPPVDKASVYMELADTFVEARDLSKAQKFLRMAEDVFKQEGHIEGELNTRLKRLAMINRKTATEVHAMLDLADSFANLSSPVSQIRALNCARSAAFQLFPRSSDFLDVHGRIQKLCTQTGNRFVQLQESFSFSAALILWPEHIGKAIETLHRYVDSPSDDLPKTKGRLATMLGQAYIMLGDREKSLTYAKLAVRAFRYGSNYEALSDATWGLANALTQGERTIDYPEAIRMLEESSDLDAKHSNLAGQVRAYDTLVTLEGMLAITGSSEFHRMRRDHWIAERQKINNQASRRDPIDKARLHLSKKEFDQAEKLAKVTLERYSAENDSESVAVCEGLIFSCLYRPFDLYSPSSPDQLLKVAHILVQARKAMAAYEALGPSGIPVPFIIEVSLAFEELGQYVPQRKSALYSEALKYLEAGETVCESMRKDLPSSSGLPALLQKRILVGYKYHREIYTRALRLAAAIGDAEQVWKWTQKSKAQALSDMVASRFVSPGYTPVQDIKDDQAVALLEEESQLLRDLESASEFDSISIRRKLDQLRVKMEGRSALGHLLRSRAGTVELQDLGWVFDSPSARCIPGNGKIVLVDWVVIDDTIVMLTLDRSLVPHMTPLDISWSQVRLWRRRNLVSEKPFNDVENYKELLEEVNGLVDGLENFTAKDDFLVLCPSADLHAIPLHALKVGGKILIVRNFVIYTTSLSMLRLCCERANAKARTRPNLDSLRTALFAPIEDENENTEPPTEPCRIYENVTQLAAEFGSVPNLGPDANRETFREYARAADILHYHGHMEYHPNDVLYQALILNDGRNKKKRRGASGGNEETLALSENQRRRKQRHEDLFTVSDIFSLRLDASLTTMIACASGVQDVSPGDEPLGLLAALLYAGSATCVGTLWPVESADGRFLSLAFYQDLCQRVREMQDQAEAQSPLNLAVSFCNAVRLLKKDNNPSEGREEWFLPYHWAAFVMHGAWFL